MNVTLTKDEIQAAIHLFDVATKAGGLAVAEIAIVLTKKLQSATEEVPVEE